MKLFEMVGSLTGIIGAAMIAAKTPHFEFGFVFFFASSLILSCLFLQQRKGWLLLQQGFFMGINFMGILLWTVPAIKTMM